MHSSAAVESLGALKDPVAVKLLAAMESQSGFGLKHKSEECPGPLLNLPLDINSLLTIAPCNLEIRHKNKPSRLTRYLSKKFFLFWQMTQRTGMLLCKH